MMADGLLSLRAHSWLAQPNSGTQSEGTLQKKRPRMRPYVRTDNQYRLVSVTAFSAISSVPVTLIRAPLLVHTGCPNGPLHIQRHMLHCSHFPRLERVTFVKIVFDLFDKYFAPRYALSRTPRWRT